MAKMFSVFVTVSVMLLGNSLLAEELEPFLSSAPLLDYEIVAAYDHDPHAFTQGLCFDHGMLYEGTGLRGQSSLRRMVLGGKSIEMRRLPDRYFGEGITVFQGKIFQLTWKARTGFIWDKESLSFLQTFSYPTDGWGITNDGKHLIMSDGSASLFFLDPQNFALEKQIRVIDGNEPVSRLNELEYIQGAIWANIWKKAQIIRIDSETGQVTGWLDFSELVRDAAPADQDSVLNGIAYDAENNRLFITGKRWQKLFEIKITERRDPPQPDSRLPGKENR